MQKCRVVILIGKHVVVHHWRAFTDKRRDAGDARQLTNHGIDFMGQCFGVGHTAGGGQAHLDVKLVAVCGSKKRHVQRGHQRHATHGHTQGDDHGGPGVTQRAAYRTAEAALEHPTDAVISRRWRFISDPG